MYYKIGHKTVNANMEVLVPLHEVAGVRIQCAVDIGNVFNLLVTQRCNDETEVPKIFQTIGIDRLRKDLPPFNPTVGTLHNPSHLCY